MCFELTSLRVGLAIAAMAVATSGCRAPSTGDRAAFATQVETSVRTYSVHRQLVVASLEVAARDLDWEFVLDAAEGIGSSRLLACSEADSRFFGLLGWRWKRTEVEALIATTANGRTRVEFVFKSALYQRKPAPLGSAAVQLTDAAKSEVRRAELEAASKKRELFEALERELRRATPGAGVPAKS